MAAGAFTITKYTDGNANIRAIRVKTPTSGLTLNAVVNAAPTGARTAGFGVMKVSGSRRSYGSHARTVTIKLTAAGASGAIGSLVRLPILTPTVFSGLAYGQTGTYNTQACVVVGTTAEKLK